MQEIWKDLFGYEGIYLASSFGRIKNKIRNKILKLSCTRNKYLCITLANNKVRKGFLVHRLIAQTFIPNPANKPVVNHLDNDKHNNRIDNLEWCTKSENVVHAIKIGAHPMPDTRGENNFNHKLTVSLVKRMRLIYKKDRTLKKIYTEFKQVNPRTIRDVINNISWKYI